MPASPYTSGLPHQRRGCAITAVRQPVTEAVVFHTRLKLALCATPWHFFYRNTVSAGVALEPAGVDRTPGGRGCVAAARGHAAGGSRADAATSLLRDLRSRHIADKPLRRFLQ